MLVHPLPIRMFLKALLSAAERCGYLGAVVLLARARDAGVQHRELIDDWTSVHDVTGPALAVLCPVPPGALPRGVRNPVSPSHGVVAEGMALEVPYGKESFETSFWNDLPFGIREVRAIVSPERRIPAEVHASGWTQAVGEAAEFFGIAESQVPCLVVLSMGERHGTVIPIDETFGVYNFLKELMERVGPTTVSLGRSLDERRELEHRIARARCRLGLNPGHVLYLNRKLAKAESLEPELIVECQARLERLAQTEPSNEDLRVLQKVADLLRSPQDRRLNLNIDRFLRELENAIGTLESRRPNWEEYRRCQEQLETVEREVAVRREEVTSINLSGLIAQVAAELPQSLHEEELKPSRLPGWSFSRLCLRPTHTVRAPTTDRVGRLGLVMVHGILSVPSMWDPLRDLLADDTDLGFVDPLAFGYHTGLFRRSPTRIFPTINVVADSLKEYLATEAEGYERLVLLAHSQGGLVVQRCLIRMLAEGMGHELSRIRRVVQLACPNNGAEFLLSLRRRILGRRHPQERQLRPLNEEVANTRRLLMRDVVHAPEVTERTCPIPFSVYAGEKDNVVPAVSAQGDFPGAAALPGDHLSIARPTSRQHRTYTTLRRLILEERPL